MTLRSVKSAIACACTGVRSGSKISTSASSCIARIRTSSSLPRPTRYLGSASGRRCSMTPITRTPAVRHSSLQLGDPALASWSAAARRAGDARRPPDVDDHQQRAIALVGRDRRGRDALELLLQRRDQRGRRPACCGRTARWAAGATAARPRPAAAGGRRAGRPGRPSGHTPIAATRSSRSSARSTRSSRVSGSLRRCVCTRRRPRKRPRAGADAADLGQVDARRVADEHVLDLAAPPDQDADLALDLARDLAQVRRQLGRRDLGGAEPPPVDALERVLLAGLEPGRIARDDVQGAEVSTGLVTGPRFRVTSALMRGRAALVMAVRP